MENEKTVIDFTGMSTSQVYKEVRRRLTEDILEFMAQKYERAVRLSNIGRILWQKQGSQKGTTAPHIGCSAAHWYF